MTGELLVEEKIIFRPRHLLLGGREEQGFIMHIALLPIRGRGWRTHVTDYFIGIDQKIPDWFIKVTFLGKAKIIIRSGIKSGFGIMDFNTSDSILDVQFSLSSYCTWQFYEYSAACYYLLSCPLSNAHLIPYILVFLLCNI